MALHETYQDKPEPIRDRDYVMPFGKHKGETIRDIIECDAQYLMWLHNQEGFDFELHADLVDDCEAVIYSAPADERWRRKVG